MTSALKSTLTEDMKNAMRAQAKDKLATIRMILAAIKQREIAARVDGVVELTDEDILDILVKMVKQRRESIALYDTGNRPDLADIEKAEIEIIQTYLPSPLTDSEIESLIQQAIADTGAVSIKDMGKVVAQLRPLVQGRADVGKVSNKVKDRLTAN